MNPALLVVPLIYGLILAAFTLVPGLAALAVALATRPRGPSAPGCVHGASMGAGVLLLGISCGFVGAGLLSVVLNFTLLAIALVSYAVSPTAGEGTDESFVGIIYMGVLLLGFLVSFALGVDRLSRWLGPKDA